MQSLKIVAILLVVSTAYAEAKSDSIVVRNAGNYVAVFTVNYNLNEELKFESSGDFRSGTNKKIEIPEAATNIYVKAQEYWFIGSKTIIFTRSYPGPVQKCFKIGGTTPNPSYAEENC